MRKYKLLIVFVAVLLFAVACGKGETESTTPIVNEENGKEPNDSNAENIRDDEIDNSANTDSEEKENDESEERTDTFADEQVISKMNRTKMYVKYDVDVQKSLDVSNSTLGKLSLNDLVMKFGEQDEWSIILFKGSVGYVKTEALSPELVQISGNSEDEQGSNIENNSSELPTKNDNENSENEVQEPEVQPQMYTMIWNGVTTDITQYVYENGYWLSPSGASELNWMISDEVLRMIGFSRTWVSNSPVYSYTTDTAVKKNVHKEIQFNFGTNSYSVNGVTYTYDYEFLVQDGKYYVYPYLLLQILGDPSEDNSVLSQWGWGTNNMSGDTYTTPYSATWE